MHHQLDMVISAGVKIKGGETVTLGCDSFLQDCEAVMHCDASTKKIECANCAIKGRALLSFAGLSYYTLNQLVTSEEIDQVNKWSKEQLPVDWAHAQINNDQLGKWSLSSLQTAFQISKSDLDRPSIVPFYQSLLRNSALCSIAVKRIIETFSPTVALVFNGRFSQYRTAYEVLRRAGIRVITHERGFSDNTFLFYDNATISETRELFAVSRPWQDRALTISQLERVREYIRGRESGKDFNTPAFIDYTTDEISVRKKLCVGKESLLGFFSSTEAEMSQAEDANIANVQIPLLSGLIEAARKRPEITFVVRHHPNLAGGSVHDPEYGFITDLYRLMSNAPTNVRTIMPTEKISTYALMWHLDGAVVPFSSVGLELSSRGSASLTSAHNPYSLAQSLSFDQLDQLDFLGVIDTLVDQSQNFSEDILRKAYRFIYSYIERASVRFDSFGIKNFYEANLTEAFVDDLKLGRDANLKRIVAGVMNGGSIYPVPDTAQDSVIQQSESTFLKVEVAKIRARKESIYKQSSTLQADCPKVLHISHMSRTSVYPLVFGQRYTNVETTNLPALHQSALSNYQQLLAALDSSDTPLIAYSHPSVSFDGNFFSSGVETFLEAENFEKRLLLRGTWLADQNGLVYSDFLSAKRGSTSKESISKTFSQGVDPLVLLSWGLYTRECFRGILLSFLSTQRNHDAEEHLVNVWNSPTTIVHKIQCGVTLYPRK